MSKQLKVKTSLPPSFSPSVRQWSYNNSFHFHPLDYIYRASIPPSLLEHQSALVVLSHSPVFHDFKKPKKLNYFLLLSYTDTIEGIPFSATMAATLSSTSNSSTISPNRFQIYRSPLKLGKFEDTHFHFRYLGSLKRNSGLKLEAASKKSFISTQELPLRKMEKLAADTSHQQDLFDEMKNRFLSYKKEKCLENLDNFQKLSKGQAPKFMVIACADSRVCPSSILGFEPGEAFMVRNVGNLVPPFENGPSETNAALEFAVNSLEVENLFVIGHSCCGGIRALMSLQNDTDSSTFIKNWVVIGKRARLSTEASAANLSFDQQCRHCEKESVNHSLVNLLTYPWVEERARKGLLTIHGGYYDFVDCTFEKWTLDYKGSNVEEGGKYSFRDQAFWS